MRRAELLEHLTTDIITYAMDGVFPERDLALALKPEELDDRFEEYERLLDLHFILQDDVTQFVRDLHQHLRSIRTETENISRTRHGTVDGRINWSATIKQRYSRNPNDRSLFVCDNRSEDYDIPENIVLKRLLAVIYETLNAAESYLRGDYEWVQQTWRGDDALIDELSDIVERNVHIHRIRDPEVYEPTERMLTQAENARQPIYRQAAQLVRRRQRLHDGDEELLKELLEETAITPDDDDTLFELFVLFKYISTIDDMRDGSFTLETITRGRQEVARFTGEKDIVLYHDNSAIDRGLSFRTGVDSAEDVQSRTDRVQLVAQKVASDYFNTDFQNHTGRPDIIVLEVQTEDGYDYLITEVKNSTRTKTIRQGIKETLEYVAFLRLNNNFVFEDPNNEDIFGDGWNGLLVIQDLDTQTASINEQQHNEINILQASELDNNLHQLLDNLV
ncbi:hypothetical protein [Halobacterium sp. KA-6]|uniref:hypothetical protein n=1 Tax=Halobacterium sp. KA-6 TaxID=2896368 RepID=UPI001E36D23E|nr:hypothetical protein [Halobacterium sp. KA-6]MCD2204536.1 hypothetical protein [Halobacterium sp. KA-6]